jgi:hypothetical protein
VAKLQPQGAFLGRSGSSCHYWHMARSHRLDAEYKIVRLPGGEAYGVEVAAEGKAPAFMIPFRTKKAAYIWIEEHHHRKVRIGAMLPPK